MAELKPTLLQALRVTSEHDLPALLRAAEPDGALLEAEARVRRTEQGARASPPLPAVTTGSSSA
eukprot:12882823-Prorocentrum_lima.AAC.1